MTEEYDIEKAKIILEKGETLVREDFPRGRFKSMEEAMQYAKQQVKIRNGKVVAQGYCSCAAHICGEPKWVLYLPREE